MVRITSKERLVVLGREIHVVVRQRFSSCDPSVPVKGEYDGQTVLRKERRSTEEDAEEQLRCKPPLSVKRTWHMNTETFLKSYPILPGLRGEEY